ncbi:MAG: SIS domain-containing protein [Collinsella sp.]
MNAHDLIQEIIERKGKVENVFWIACGGSMIDLMPANELLKREATTFTSTVYTAREFCLMAPKSLGPKSLVMPAATAATRRRSSTAARWRGAGAEVVALTDCEGSRSTTEVDHLGLPWGEGVSQAEVPQGIGALIAAELLDQQECYEALADMYEGLKQMDALLPAAREKVNAELGARFAELCQQHKFFYILGSGPNFSQTYAMAICSLMEMQWQHCCYIHSGEYFHGPFEATEPGVFYFVQLGAGECRPMEERALAFLNTHTDTIMVLDALEYGVGDVPASVRSYLEPIFFYNMSCELRAARGKVFDHSPGFVATWASSSTRYRELSFWRARCAQAPFALWRPVRVGENEAILFREVNDLF